MASPYDSPPLATLYSRVTADISSAMAQVPALLVRILRLAGGAALGGGSWALHKQIEIAGVQGLPSSATDDGLDGWGQVGNRDRNPAAAWQGTIQVWAEGLSVVPALARLTLRGATTLYEVVTGHTWGAPTGYAILSVRAIVAGPASNVEAGDVLQFVSPPAGVTSGCFVYSVTAYGVDVEDDPTYRPDVIAGVQGAGAQGGNLVDWVAWAKAVPGVFAAVVTSPDAGHVTVKIAASDGAVPPGPGVPDSGLLAAVTAALVPKIVDVRVTVIGYVFGDSWGD